MRVLVAWGSRLGGTAGIGLLLADALRGCGLDVVESGAAEAPSPRGFDAVILGGALYANRWHADARRYVARHARALREVPTWLFSSGPLDPSADRAEIPPIREVRAIMGRIGALGHRTFGGRLDPAVRWFPARAMARSHAGDWRNSDRIRTWACEIAATLPARPRPAEILPGRSFARIAEYGVVGWAIMAAAYVVLLVTTDAIAATTVKWIAATVAFGWLARAYQRGEGARGPLPVAVAWTALAAVLDATIVSGAIRDAAFVHRIAAFWIPLALVFVVSWAAGEIAAMLPLPRPSGDGLGGVPRDQPGT